jgi:hypothetical protein
MNNNIGNEKYDSIAIPPELDSIVNNTIEMHKKELYRMKFFKNRKFAASLVAAGLLISFTTTLNVNEAFAESMSNVPIVSKIASALTFVDYSYETEDIKGDINVAQVENLKDTEFEKKINSIIKEKTDMAIEKGNESIAEYKEAFLDTGGTKEDWAERNNDVKVGYTLFTETESVVSFTVYSYNSVAASTAEYDYYNINLESSKEITLTDLLGSDYVVSITQSVEDDFKKQLANDEITFFEGVGEGDWEIRKDIDFYIDNNGNPVVVFDKYEIAAGANGRLEYVID